MVERGWHRGSLRGRIQGFQYPFCLLLLRVARLPLLILPSLHRRRLGSLRCCRWTSSLQNAFDRALLMAWTALALGCVDLGVAITRARAQLRLRSLSVRFLVPRRFLLPLLRLQVFLVSLQQRLDILGQVCKDLDPWQRILLLRVVDFPIYRGIGEMNALAAMGIRVSGALVWKLGFHTRWGRSLGLAAR